MGLTLRQFSGLCDEISRVSAFEQGGSAATIEKPLEGAAAKLVGKRKFGRDKKCR